jgi:hypothetical protein
MGAGMGRFRRWMILAGLAALLAPAQALADAKDGVFNKEHVWAIDVDHGACAASRTLDDGSVFLFRAQEGQLTFGFFSRSPLKAGKAGRLETEAYGFDFAPSFGDGGTSLYFNGNFNARAVAAIRLARDVTLRIDGRPVAAMRFEGTGFEDALDGVIACSQGASGWWGKGVGPEPTDTGPRPDKATNEPVLNKERAWAIAISEEPEICVVEALASDHLVLQILAARGATGLALSADVDLPRGTRGQVQTDDYVFDFVPGYGGRRYLSAKQPFDVAAIQALYRAKWLRLSIDKRQLLDIDLTDTGFADLPDSVAACSKGQKGWWGAGAKPRP